MYVVYHPSWTQKRVNIIDLVEGKNRIFSMLTSEREGRERGGVRGRERGKTMSVKRERVRERKRERERGKRKRERKKGESREVRII